MDGLFRKVGLEAHMVEEVREGGLKMGMRRAEPDRLTRELADAIRAVIVENGLSQPEIGERLGPTKAWKNTPAAAGWVGKLLRGELQSVTASMREAAIEALGLDLGAKPSTQSATVGEHMIRTQKTEPWQPWRIDLVKKIQPGSVIDGRDADGTPYVAKVTSVVRKGKKLRITVQMETEDS
jgi:hypothetical protein